MDQKWGDPKVKAYMKTHKEEVERVQKRYEQLKVLSLGKLVALANGLDADVSKIRDKLIVAIITAEGTQ